MTMCEMANQSDPDQGETCTCALNAMKDQLSSDEFEIYANVGTLYLENLTTGLDRAEAWDAAARTVGGERQLPLVSVLEITNPIGRMHAKAIKECKG